LIIKEIKTEKSSKKPQNGKKTGVEAGGHSVIFNPGRHRIHNKDGRFEKCETVSHFSRGEGIYRHF
jgi:hypothetical protein